jgi:integrase/recombinase XerD
MELVWSNESYTISGHKYAGFPILLWDTMHSCTHANSFFRHHLLRGRIGSKKSWTTIAQAIYDYFSFISAHELDWRDVQSGESKNLLAGYRDYCLFDMNLKTSTTRLRLVYICYFYKYALKREWISKLPFEYEERSSSRPAGYFAHINSNGGKVTSNNIMPRHHKHFPKFLTLNEIKRLLTAVDNPHHHMIIRFALQTGLRREEIATFPLSYLESVTQHRHGDINVHIYLDPYDGSGMKTKGKKPRTIYISKTFLDDIKRYVNLYRGERAGLNKNNPKTLFINRFGESFSSDGKALERIIRTAGMKVSVKANPHKLRHSYATHTLVKLRQTESPIDPLIFLQRQLGHNSVDTTAIYLHIVEELAENAVLLYDTELNTNWSEQHGEEENIHKD